MIAIKHMLPINTKHNKPIVEAPSIKALCANDKIIPIKPITITGINVENITASMAVCVKFGISPEKIISAVSECNGVKGRCEIIPTGRNFTVICDYAHTPDAVENILSNVKEYCEGRLICKKSVLVFLHTFIISGV